MHRPTRNNFSAKTVANHYNNRRDQGFRERQNCRIFHMRNYNNWIKSMLINQALKTIKPDERSNKRLSVLDLCSGKGGDLLKWKMAGIDRLVCVDIAETSVEQSKARYQDLGKKPTGREKPLFSADFFAADCSKERIAELEGFPRKDKFDLTSCQFALHYSFESLAQAKMMLKNACENLREGGLFIGTIPNAQVLVKRLKNTQGTSFGNDIYRVKFDVKDKENIPLFGAKYHFFLEGAVDCPEFLVYFPLLEVLAKDESMELVEKFTFKDFHYKHSGTPEGWNLLSKMQGLEQYPPKRGKKRDYAHAESKMASRRCNRVWTLSEPEWEATNLYMVFVFKKVSKSSKKDEEKPVRPPLIRESRLTPHRDNTECQSSRKEVERCQGHVLEQPHSQSQDGHQGQHTPVLGEVPLEASSNSQKILNISLESSLSVTTGNKKRPRDCEDDNDDEHQGPPSKKVKN